MDRSNRIRLRLPSGAEMEAEGSEEFVRAERQEFLGRLGQETPPIAPASQAAPEAPKIPWEAITELKGRSIQLRAKLGGDKTDRDACLVLLAASQNVLRQPKPTATQLAKWLRRSGYPIRRMDRMLQASVEQGEILSSGSRRARRYELTSSGRLKALLLAEQLGKHVAGTA